MMPLTPKAGGASKRQLSKYAKSMGFSLPTIAGICHQETGLLLKEGVKVAGELLNDVVIILMLQLQNDELLSKICGIPDIDAASYHLTQTLIT